MTDLDLSHWPDCAVDGCPNKCCLALNSRFCFPHTPGNPHVKHMKIEAQLIGIDLGSPSGDRWAEFEIGPDGTARLIREGGGDR